MKAGIVTDVSLSSVFVLPDVATLRRVNEKKEKAYTYTRYANPTTTVAEKKIAALEGSECCVVTASGMAAVLCTILTFCKAGDEIVSMLDVYGGTLQLYDPVLKDLGIRTVLVPFGELPRIERYFTPRSKLLMLETPTNPGLRCVDIAALAAKAKKAGIRTAVDNTFATPVLQKPIALGADISLHSATKYLGGHSDVTAGVVCGPYDVVEPAREMMLTTGGNLDPMASYLLIRGMKTLELRVERACANARQIAHRLERHPKVARVMYPGLKANAGHAAAARQMKDFGMMVSFDIRGGGKAAERFIDRLRLWYLATSLGGVESTVSYPILASHLHTPAEQLRLMEVSAATVRLSVGIENANDLLSDLEQALG